MLENNNSKGGGLMEVKILIVDDNKDILYAMSAICQYGGWQAVLATNVLEALEEFKKNKPDLVIMDYHLPIISGIEGVKRIRRLDKLIPIIVLTVEEDQKVADEFIDVGASDFALKPIKAPDMIARINVHLKYKDSRNKPLEEEGEYIKGIAFETLDTIQNYMKKTNQYETINSIAQGSGLAYQTVHRYLQHMEGEELVDVSYKYGKIGRPQKRYKLNKT